MPRPLALLGLATFLVADAVLVWAVVVKSGDDTAPPVDDVVPRTHATASVSPKPVAITASPKAPTVKPAETVLLSISRDETIAMATRQSCDAKQAVNVRVSTDLGKKFVDRQTPVTQILDLKADSRDDLTIVGTDVDCVVGSWASTDQGATWAKLPAIAGWYVDPSRLDKVVSPKRTGKPGCDVISISATSDTFARVTCSNGTILGTGNAGKAWQDLGHLADVRAAVFPAPGNGMALASYQGCAAHGFTTRDGGRTWSKAGCIAGAKAQAIAYSGSTLVAIVDGGVFVSANKGETWTQP